MLAQSLIRLTYGAWLVDVSRHDAYFTLSRLQQETTVSLVCTVVSKQSNIIQRIKCSVHATSDCWVIQLCSL